MSALLEELNVIDYELIVAVCPVIRVKQRIEYSPRPVLDALVVKGKVLIVCTHQHAKHNVLGLFIKIRGLGILIFVRGGLNAVHEEGHLFLGPFAGIGVEVVVERQRLG